MSGLFGGWEVVWPACVPFEGLQFQPLQSFSNAERAAKAGSAGFQEAIRCIGVVQTDVRVCVCVCARKDV